MRNTGLILVIIVLFFSCKNEKESSEISIYCDNELSLLSSFDTLTSIPYRIFELQDSAMRKISKSFDKDICCQELRFNTVFNCTNGKTISLSLNSYYPCDNCPIFIRERNYCVILLNKQGQVLFEGRMLPLDSIANRISFLYSQIGKGFDYPERCDNFYVLIDWDREVEAFVFQKFISEIISGYLEHVDNVSQLEYKRELCSIDKSELLEISEKIPFNLRINIEEVKIEDDFEKENNKY